MDWIAAIIKTVIDNASPQLREAMKVALDKWEAAAKATTQNPWDDILVLLLRKALDL